MTRTKAKRTTKVGSQRTMTRLFQSPTTQNRRRIHVLFANLWDSRKCTGEKIVRLSSKRATRNGRTQTNRNPTIKAIKTRLQQKHHRLPECLTSSPWNSFTLTSFSTESRFDPSSDSGSTITAISRSAAERLNLNWNAEKAVQIRQAQGKAKTLGVIDATIHITGRSFRIPVHVIEDLNHDMLIGLDVGRIAELNIDFSAQSGLHLMSSQSSNSISFLLPITIDTVLNRTDVFAQSPTDFGRIRNTEHVIRLKPDAVPFNLPPYRLSPAREAELKKHIDELLAAGLISQIILSFWVSNVFGSQTRLRITASGQLQKAELNDNSRTPSIANHSATCLTNSPGPKSSQPLTSLGGIGTSNWLRNQSK